jgi:6-phosphogluconolactonase (cycloisomerase 2 family)
MRALKLLSAAALGVGAFAALPATSSTAAPTHAVFAATNDPSGNAIKVWRDDGGGHLTFVATYATGGEGGTAAGAAADPLASQSSLVFDGEHDMLFAVNAGSDTLTAFHVDGTTLDARQVIRSDGEFPTSVAVHGDLVYVLNAAGAGSVHGYRIENGALHAIFGSTRSLGLANTNPPDFLKSPGEVAFTADGHALVVTTKANGSILGWGVHGDGRLDASASVSAPAGQVPFSTALGRDGSLLISEAGTASVTSYAVGAHGAVTPTFGPVTDNGAATCWIHRVGRFVYVSNTGSNTLSRYELVGANHLALVEQTAATTSGGPTDLASSADGRVLYGENGLTGHVEIYRIGASGALTSAGFLDGLTPQVAEGLATS